MGYHHLALAARDMAAIHRFYEEVMGFEVEFCLTTGAFTADDRAAAIAALGATAPAFGKPPPRIEMHRASAKTRPA